MDKKVSFSISSLKETKDGIRESRVSFQTEAQVSNWVKKYIHPDSNIVGVKIIKKTIVTNDVTDRFMLGVHVLS